MRVACEVHEVAWDFMRFDQRRLVGEWRGEGGCSDWVSLRVTGWMEATNGARTQGGGKGGVGREGWKGGVEGKGLVTQGAEQLNEGRTAILPIRAAVLISLWTSRRATAPPSSTASA